MLSDTNDEVAAKGVGQGSQVLQEFAFGVFTIAVRVSLELQFTAFSGAIRNEAFKVGFGKF
jgi:hypothetical protein